MIASLQKISPFSKAGPDKERKPVECKNITVLSTTTKNLFWWDNRGLGAHLWLGVLPFERPVLQFSLSANISTSFEFFVSKYFNQFWIFCQEIFQPVLNFQHRVFKNACEGETWIGSMAGGRSLILPEILFHLLLLFGKKQEHKFYSKWLKHPVLRDWKSLTKKLNEN